MFLNYVCPVFYFPGSRQRIICSWVGMQTLFQNPLAGPFVLGINAGASLGVALATLLTGALASLGLAASSWLGSSLVLFVMIGIAGRLKNNITLLILGLMFGYGVSALVSVLIHFSSPEQIQQFVLWSFGSFSSVTWQQLSFVPVSFVRCNGDVFLAKPLNALLLGESYASTMGVSVRHIRLALVFVTAILAGTVTAFCGPIAFSWNGSSPFMQTLLEKRGSSSSYSCQCSKWGVLALAADFLPICLEVLLYCLLMPLRPLWGLLLLSGLYFEAHMEQKYHEFEAALLQPKTSL